MGSRIGRVGGVLCLAWLLSSAFAVAAPPSAPDGDSRYLLPPPALDVALAVPVTEVSGKKDPLRTDERGATEADAGELAREFTGRKLWTVRMGLSAVYDTNAIVSPHGSGDKKGDKRDFKGVFTADVSYEFFSTPSDRIVGGLSVYTERYSGNHNIDIATVGGYAFYQHQAELFTEYLRYAYTTYFFDDRVFIREHTLSPAIYWPQGGPFGALVSLEYYHRDYPKDRPLSGDEIAALWTQYYFFGEGDEYVYLSLRYGKYDANDNDESYDNIIAAVGVSVPLSTDIVLDARAALDARNYWSREAIFGKLRDDRRREFSIYLTKQLTEKLKAQLGYMYVFNESNVPTDEYYRQLISFGITADF